jgi:hypothetical protein
MRDPLTHTDRGYTKRSRGGPVVTTGYVHDVIGKEEEIIRNSIIELDEQMAKLERKKLQLKKSIKAFDDKRAKSASEMETRRRECAMERKRTSEAMNRQEEKKEALPLVMKQNRTLEAKKLNQEKNEALPLLKARKALEERTCGVCRREFVNKHARDQHYEAVHHMVNSKCKYCGRSFNSSHSLNQHRDALGHW